ncbi:hypothetical protein P152DRAFT_242531 [Eremomyces bilateralis CBS 781.70]|uniref:Uncharacterized protein n=1 Tax=Eremomyces bilateralis CBS 781.70 TaxID=1392243 RepID=A0A6G1GAA4_9PEZI|nr:uncharacterized protein P152DRAFT_242531 [Eremomyces bilateralis CBS 781.70]KAF1815017.1 hypothetical protein P152DRAFT_242531 [Eremomyces bilateralis CBS 781.70]
MVNVRLRYLLTCPVVGVRSLDTPCGPSGLVCSKVGCFTCRGRARQYESVSWIWGRIMSRMSQWMTILDMAVFWEMERSCKEKRGTIGNGSTNRDQKVRRNVKYFGLTPEDEGKKAPRQPYMFARGAFLCSPLHTISPDKVVCCSLFRSCAVIHGS